MQSSARSRSTRAGYQVQSTYWDRKKNGKYTASNVDVLVAYVIPLDLWYVVLFECPPGERLLPRGGVRRPRLEQSRSLASPPPQAQQSRRRPQIHPGSHLARRAACPERSGKRFPTPGAIGSVDEVFQALIDRSRSPLDLKTIKTIVGYQRRPKFHGRHRRSAE